MSHTVRAARSRHAHTVMLTVLLAAGASFAAPSPSAVLFTQKCSACHNIGDGPKVGPDLLGVTERRDAKWIAAFVRAPGAAIDRGDKVAVELYEKFNKVKMPDQPLSDAELDGLLAYFAECTRAKGCKPVQAGPKFATDATPEEIDLGRRLFEGHARLSGRGPACLGCHNVRGAGLVGGGTLAADLTFAFARMGEKGLTPALTEPRGQIHRTLYRGPHAFSEEETYAFKAYLAHASRDGARPRRDRDFLYLGLAAAAVVLGLVFALRGDAAGRKEQP